MARDYEPDRRSIRQMMASREMQAVCVAAAQPIAAAVAALTPRDTGETAASTRVEADRVPDGRAGAKVVQGGAGVPVNWGNRGRRGSHHITDALGRAT